MMQRTRLLLRAFLGLIYLCVCSGARDLAQVPQAGALAGPLIGGTPIEDIKGKQAVLTGEGLSTVLCRLCHTW